jgi:hypothetical protein
MLFPPTQGHNPIAAKAGMVRLGHMARHRGMTGICAFRPAGVDVKLPLRGTAVDCAVGKVAGQDGGALADLVDRGIRACGSLTALAAPLCAGRRSWRESLETGSLPAI